MKPSKEVAAAVWRIVVKPSAARELALLGSKPDRQRLVDLIATLAFNPRPQGCEKLSGQIGLYRVRSGNFRVVYEIVDDLLLVSVIKVGHRKSIYRKL